MRSKINPIPFFVGLLYLLLINMALCVVSRQPPRKSLCPPNQHEIYGLTGNFEGCK